MRARTKKPPTNDKHVGAEASVGVSVDELLKKEFPDRPSAGVYLQGIRHREGLTQSELAKKLGTNQANVSNMEHGKRPIGKGMAKKIGELFDIDYRYFL